MNFHAIDCGCLTAAKPNSFPVDRAFFKVVYLIGLLMVTQVWAQAEVALPALFSDHMVLQQGQAIPVWGTAAAGESVTVSVAGQSKQTVADGQGNWKVSLDPLKPGRSLTVMVAGKNTLTVQDVLVGEVWVASGQSNMQYRMSWDKVYNGPDIAAATNHKSDADGAIARFGHARA